MTTIAVQWIMANDNGVPADAVMNTWHFKTDDTGTPEEQGADCAGRVATFYQDIDAYLSSFLSGAVLARCFDLSDPEPRVPINELPFTMAGLSGTAGFPCELAVCLSYQANRVSGSPQARRRGRLYIGPLSAAEATLVDDAASGDMIVGAAFRAALANAASNVAGVFFGPSSGGAMAWCTFSPTDVSEGKTLSEASHNVTNGWIDFAGDIQRRRGHAAGGRTLWTD